MQRGLDGRRVAVFVSSSENAQQRETVVTRALEQAGARINVLNAAGQRDEDFHGAKYAALVLIGDGTSTDNADARVIQLTREFLASDKPVAVFGSALNLLLEAGGAAGRSLAADTALKPALEAAGATCVDDPIRVDETLITARGNADVNDFASRLVEELSSRLEDRALDEMSEMSFPASDPPATTPGSVGHIAPDRDSDTRP
jgi:putative intracellular protease/amidase